MNSRELESNDTKMSDISLLWILSEFCREVLMEENTETS
jgi:hypothetical protein